MFKVGKSRGAVWTEPYEGDTSIQFKILPLTPALVDKINNEYLQMQLVNENGKNRVDTRLSGFGMSRDQAKQIITDWKGIVDEDEKPLPCNESTKARLFDEWDDNGHMAAFVVKQANKYAELREAQLKNFEAPSVTS